MEGLESQIAEWRTYVASAPAVNGHDVDELEDHLRHQIAELNTAGLAEDEAFLVAVKRLGDMDAVSREFAREHSDRLWKQLLGPGEEASPAPSGWVEALVFAVGAAVAIEVARLVAGFPDEEPTWFAIFIPLSCATLVTLRSLRTTSAQVRPTYSTTAMPAMPPLSWPRMSEGPA